MLNQSYKHLASAGLATILPPKELTPEEIMSLMPPNEALTAVYRPIVIQELACHYINQAIISCKIHMLTIHRKVFPQQARLLKQLVEEYQHETYSMVSDSSVKIFKSKVREFISDNRDDLTKLWWAFNSEIKRNHPDLTAEQYSIVCDAMMALAFIEFYFAETVKMARLFEARLGIADGNTARDYMRRMKKPLCDMTYGCDVEQEKATTIVTGLKIIVNRVLRLQFNLID